MPVIRKMYLPVILTIDMKTVLDTTIKNRTENKKNDKFYQRCNFQFICILTVNRFENSKTRK